MSLSYKQIRCLYRILIAPAILIAAAGCREDAESPSGPSAEPSPSVASIRAGGFIQLSGGDSHTCGLSSENRAYCWGYGLLGDGQDYHLAANPAAVTGSLTFRQVSAGTDHFCGITTDRRAYCWGGNFSGQLGDGTTEDRRAPVAVAGGLQFRSIEAGFFHTCGVTYPDNLAYCWGSNIRGKLGDGSTNDRTTPVAVTGGHRFRHITTGWDHTCGVTTASEAYCWGSNMEGQVGDGSALNRRQRPVRVAGSHEFKLLDAGAYFTCGVTTDGAAYCWGQGEFGQMGDGDFAERRTPVAVGGGVLFDRLTAGYSHACAETESNALYCWGNNIYGMVGDGSDATRTTPVEVVGARRYAQATAGSFHSCALTPAGAAFCWGSNGNGEVGDGTRTNRQVPVSVAGAI